ncbi:MAG: CPBP family glutamic-type intramembrane protease [Phycisphaerales bacterium]|jgi:hypothetical protein|nr:CPBP family glutamic-type intramembrane protease [Phycisphaerales bacterium]
MGTKASRARGKVASGSAKRSAPASEAPARPSIDEMSYAQRSRRPLHVLCLLLPLIVLYEIGSVLYLADPASGTMETIRAQRMLADFFELFGAVGLHLPAALIVTVLLVWHVLLRDPWTIKLPTLGAMAMESTAWSAPLLVLMALIAPHTDRSAIEVLAGGELHQMPLLGRLTLAIGAGLYEELLFRMIGLALLDLVLVDLARLRAMPARIAGVVVVAVAFAAYHRLSGADGSMEWRRAISLTLAGLFFGGLYLWRGFGIAAAAHAVYDMVVLSLSSP